MNRLRGFGHGILAALVSVAGALDGDLEILAFNLNLVDAGLGYELDQVLYFFLGHGLVNWGTGKIQRGKVTGKLAGNRQKGWFIGLLGWVPWPI